MLQLLLHSKKAACLSLTHRAGDPRTRSKSPCSAVRPGSLCRPEPRTCPRISCMSLSLSLPALSSTLFSKHPTPNESSLSVWVDFGVAGRRGDGEGPAGSCTLCLNAEQSPALLGHVSLTAQGKPSAQLSRAYCPGNPCLVCLSLALLIFFPKPFQHSFPFGTEQGGAEVERCSSLSRPPGY